MRKRATQSPEAVFEVIATDEHDALHQVGRHPAGKYYGRLSATLHKMPGVVAFTKVNIA